MAAATPPVKKACDACHRRKVRCSGGVPCKNCGQASLQCTYLAIPQKKGPKGSRAKVISEIRTTQSKQVVSTPSVTTSQPITSPIAPVISRHDSEPNPFNFSTPPMSPASHVRDLGLLSPSTVDNCIRFFFEHHYPTMPIFDRQRLSKQIIHYQTGPPEVYCFILSLCAFIMVQPGMTFDGMPDSYNEDPVAARYRHANALLHELMRIRKTTDYIESPTIYSVQISFFIFCCYFGLDKSNQCWYHLREASTLAHILNMDQESTYQDGDRIDMMYNRRFYWLLLVTERAHAMERHRPLSMLATIDLPQIEPGSPDATIMPGFLYLATLFRLMDDEFMALWNKAKTECSPAYISRLQGQLRDALPSTLECTENQAADVKVTQHWLRCMVWQLSITNGYLRSQSDDAALTFRYPIQIVKDLIHDIRTISRTSMEVHGVGLIEKFFDMACTLSDVITYVLKDDTTPQDPSEPSPQQHLTQLLNLISRLRGGASRYVPLLMHKVRENIPNMANPLSHMPASLDAFVSSPATASVSAHSVPTPTGLDLYPPPPLRQAYTHSPAQTFNYHHPPHHRAPSFLERSRPQFQDRPLSSSTLSANPLFADRGSATPGLQLPLPPISTSLMFEAYSPSVTGRSLTPTSGLGTPGAGAMPYTPRSVPPTSAGGVGTNGTGAGWTSYPQQL